MAAKLLKITSILALPATLATTTATYPNNWPWKLSYPPLVNPTGGYPIPPTNSPQVLTWKASINMATVPNIKVVSTDTNGMPMRPTDVDANCDWTWNPTCRRPGDIFYCPDKAVWGLVGHLN
ncbi:hypothetical protein BC937DRAFT_89190 [Endogone sp. FLAS-F59071]|nr:hypothetical protein BC937DRAFT_89190 [Endogone sp. FLAS-F59071]|eukprot:RUS18053.1 hypothetical protein BC937DRAFT_89190 [Endogone sp. FLAS-F59071]